MHKSSDIQWVIARSNDAESRVGELGVMIGNQIFTLHKGESMELSDGEWRPLAKREFGEVIESTEDPEFFDWAPIRNRTPNCHSLRSSDSIHKIDDDTVHVHVNEANTSVFLSVNVSRSTFRIAVANAGSLESLNVAMNRVTWFVKDNRLSE